jgi:hypothetical protein
MTLSVLLPLFHAAHACADVGLLWFLRRRPGPARLVRVVLAMLATTGVLALGVTAFGTLLAFRFLGLLAAGGFVHLPLVLLVAAVVSWRRSRSAAWTALAGLAPILAVGIMGFVIGPTALEVSHVRIESPKLTAPLRIAVLADIQSDRIGDYERRAVRLAMAEKPDLVLLPGDFVQAGKEELGRERAALARVFAEEGLAAPLGVHAVGGNTDGRGWESIFRDLPARAYTRTETIDVRETRLTGLTMLDSHDVRLRVPASERFHIVFGHYPDFALGDVRADLLVAGHCHGGQVRIPFFGPPITLSKVPRAWTEGAHEIRPGTTLVVSRGIGMERGGAPRVRFLCRPEVVIIDLVPVAAAPD